MSSSKLTPHVRTFLAANLDSFEKLELVERLARIVEPISRVTLVSQLGGGENIEAALDELVRAGWVDTGPDHAALQLSMKARQDVDLQATLFAYRDDRVAILGAMSSIAMDKIRSMAARTFADAFVLRKKGRSDDG